MDGLGRLDRAVQDSGDTKERHGKRARRSADLLLYPGLSRHHGDIREYVHDPTQRIGHLYGDRRDFVRRQLMGIGYYNSLITMQAAGPTLTASNTATSLLNPQAKVPLPAGFFSYIGQKLKVLASGQLGNIVTTPGTLTLTFNLGASGTTVVFNGGAMQLSSTAHTTLPFWLEIDLTLRALGTGAEPTANFIGQGRMTAQSLSLTAVADSTTTPATLLLPNTTPAVGTSFHSTIANVPDLVGTFSLNNANAITVQQYELISPNWGG